MRFLRTASAVRFFICKRSKFMIYYGGGCIIEGKHQFKLSSDKMHIFFKDILYYGENTFYSPYLFDELPLLTVYYMYDEVQDKFNIEACMPISKKADKNIINKLCKESNTDKNSYTKIFHDIIISREEFDLGSKQYKTESNVYESLEILITIFKINFKFALHKAYCYAATGDKKHLKE